MQQQTINLLLLSPVFLVLFVLCEWLYHRRGWQAEHSRKVAHAGAGLLSLAFPFLLHDFWVVALICGLFLTILVVTKYTGLMRSIHAIDRVSYGSTMFPFVVCLCFWRFSQTQQLIQYYLPILIMALADPTACLVGKRFPSKKLYQNKTLAGSLAFFIVAVSLTLIMAVATGYAEPFGSMMLLALLIGLASTTAEALSGQGLDNLTIPMTTLLVLHWQNLFP